VLRHQHPANQEKTGCFSKLPKNLDEVTTEAVTIEQLSAAVGAGGDKLQFAGFKVAPVLP